EGFLRSGTAKNAVPPVEMTVLGMEGALSFERGAIFRGAPGTQHRPIASGLKKPQPEQVDHKFPLVKKRKFGFSMRAAGENDGSLHKTRAVAQEFAKERRLKGIATRRKMLKIAEGNQIGPDYAIPGSAIADGRDTSEPAHQASPRQADEFAMPREAGDCSSRSETRADDDVITIVGQADHPRQNGRV